MAAIRAESSALLLRSVPEINLHNAADALQNAPELRAASDYVGEITSKVINEEVLNRIFDRFCIEKQRLKNRDGHGMVIVALWRESEPA